jgi:hypothetical protein
MLLLLLRHGGMRSLRHSGVSTADKSFISFFASNPQTSDHAQGFPFHSVYEGSWCVALKVQRRKRPLESMLRMT